MYQKSRTKENDASQKLVRLGIRVYARINKVFTKVSACLYVIIVPQLTSYQWRVSWLYLLQLLCNDMVLIAVAKTLQYGWEIQNFLLLLSVGSLPPFLWALYNLMFLIPCPPLPAIITNIVLIFSFVVLLSLAVTTYAPTMGIWGVYGFLTLVWPWLVLASMISRLYVQRSSSGRNPFSPVRELPMLGILGAVAMVLQFSSAKNMTVTDCIVMCCIDPIVAAMLASIALGKARRQLHFKRVQIYIVIALLMMLYLFGELGPGNLQVATPTGDHINFAVARLLLVTRSVYCKWQYADNYQATTPAAPPEGPLLFYAGTDKPKKHRFRQFPEPMLMTLDAIFDSGLRDDQMHGMGPLGTQDLYMLTDSSYMLPIAALMAWLNEQDTMSAGILPRVLTKDLAHTASAVAIAAQGTAAAGTGMTPVIYEDVSMTEIGIIIMMLVLFALSRICAPWATSKALFDRGSSIHTWKYQPIFLVTPVFMYDVLYLNGTLSKFQIIVVVFLAVVMGLYRNGLWDAFKRKHLLMCTQELHYHQPSVLRKIQRKTLLEFLDRTSTDDYNVMLLETSIRHGGNIRELARDTSVEIWDPTPSATAAWKLAFSLVSKALKRQKYLIKQRREAKNEMERWISGIIVDMVHNAVETSVGHGGRLKHAGALSQAFSKRKAIRCLQVLAERRRKLRLMRKNGQLSAAPELLAIANGNIRSVSDMLQPAISDPRKTGGPGHPFLGGTDLQTLSQTGMQGALAAKHMSLTAGGNMSSTFGRTEENAPLLMSMPGEISIDMGESDRPWSGTKQRGIWANVDPHGAQPGARLILSFGVPRHGQLGVEPVVAAKQMLRSLVLTVEDLRGCDPVQVVAAGVSSFAVGARGQLWAFGSNRSMELGARKEIAQVNQPQRVKSLRAQRAVQVASCVAASGQAHTLLLDAEGSVYTFGTSGRGALGQGAEVRQTGPLVLRMTTQVPIRLIAAGARHSLMVTDDGRTYSFGDNNKGQLGFGQRDPGSGMWKPKSIDSPEPVQGELERCRVRMICAGDDHNLAATDDGRLFAWGANANGQLGLGRVDDQAIPLPIRDLQGADISSLAAGSRHSLVVARRGTQVWAFGSNVQGQLGIGQSSVAGGQQLTIPTLVQTLSNQLHTEIIQVAAAACHSLAVTRIGEIYSFGDNSHGQLGFPTEGTAGAGGQARNARANQIDVPSVYQSSAAQLHLPTRIVTLAAYKVRSVSTAEFHTLVLAD